MNPDNKPDQSTEEWFNNIQSPAVRPPIGDDSTPHRSNTWKFILSGVLILALIGIGAIGFVIRNVQKTPVAATCLSNKYYEELIGTSTDSELPAGESFYTDSISFIPKTTTYTKETATDTTKLLEKIGNFYKKHGSSSSIMVTLSSDYVEGSTYELPQKRLEKVRQDLLTYGVAKSAITTKAPKAISVEPDYAVEEGPTLISIVSTSSCKAK